MSRHPITQDEYELAPEGSAVRVIQYGSGQEGAFSSGGVWLSGELSVADPQMIRYVVDQARFATKLVAAMAADHPTPEAPA